MKLLKKKRKKKRRRQCYRVRQIAAGTIVAARPIHHFFVSPSSNVMVIYAFVHLFLSKEKHIAVHRDFWFGVSIAPVTLPKGRLTVVAIAAAADAISLLPLTIRGRLGLGKAVTGAGPIPLFVYPLDIDETVECLLGAILLGELLLSGSRALEAVFSDVVAGGSGSGRMADAEAVW